jgi:hypothetical protein
LYIAELIRPGTWLDYDNHEWRHEVDGALYELENCLSDVALALSWFEDEQAAAFAPGSFQERMADSMARSDRVRQKQRAMAAERGIDEYDREGWDGLRFPAEVSVKRDMWRGGALPDSYQHRKVFIHARSYVYALDRLMRTLEFLAGLPDIPQEVVAAPSALREVLPHLRDVRDSVAHHDERRRGVRHGGRPIDLKPMDNKLVKAPHGGVLVTESLNGNLFGSMLANGHYGEVEVSAQILGRATEIVQALIGSFKWKGDPDHLPR